MDTPETSPDNGQDAIQDKFPGQPQDVQADDQDASELWLPLREAAPLLGLSVEAARKRAQRGTLRARKANDGWLIAMPAGLDASPDSGQDVQRVVLNNNSNTGQDVHQDRVVTSGGHVQDGDQEILPADPPSIAPLVDLVADLTRQNADLAAAAALWQERARFLSERLAALESGPVEASPESPETGHAPEAAQNGPGRVDPPEMMSDTLQEASAKPVPAQPAQATGLRRLWRRIMGHEG